MSCVYLPLILTDFVDAVKNMVKGVFHLIGAALSPPSHLREFEK